MEKSFFRDSGPHTFRETALDTFEASIKLEPDERGMVARACPDESCAPGYFKVRPGTGLTDRARAYCPYCGGAEEPRAFPSKAQIEYGKAVVVDQAIAGISDMIRSAFKLDSSGKKKYGGGMFSMEIQYKEAPRAPVRQPPEEELRREVMCPHCGLDHAVFGLASVCPDCGRDILIAHVREELAVIARILEAIPGRHATLGARVAARDAENALEDLVSIFEAVLKVITRKALAAKGRISDDIEETFRKQVRNEYQNIQKGSRTYADLVGGELFACLSEAEILELEQIFEKRHPITHNLGIVDRKYLQRAAKGELEGREIRVTESEIHAAIALVERVLAGACVEAPQVGSAKVQLPTAQPSQDGPLPGLSDAARAIAEYLVKHSELGHDRDPTIPVGDLEAVLGRSKDDLLRGACELEAIDCLWIQEPMPNSQDEIAPRPRLFEFCDAAWMQWSVPDDAHALAEMVLQMEAVNVALAAEERGWSPRRMNAALGYLESHQLVDLGAYAHPYWSYRIHATEQTLERLRALRKA